MTKEELAANVGKEIQVGVGKMILRENPDATDDNWRYFVGDDDNGFYLMPSTEESEARSKAYEEERQKLREEDPQAFLADQAFRHRLATGGKDGGQVN